MRKFSVLSFLLFTFQTMGALPPGVWQNPLLLMVPTDKDKAETGSGFLFSHSNGVFLVTARHVLFNPAASNTWNLKGTNLILSGFATNRAVPIIGSANIGELHRIKLAFPHQERDIAVVHLAVHSDSGPRTLGIGDASNPGVFAQLVTLPERMPQLVSIDTVRPFSELQPGDTSYVLGYPTSVTTKFPDVLDVRRPLIRQALIADTDPIRKHIVLDCAVYKGNSGGPVMVVDESNLFPKLYSVGVVSKFVPFPEEWQNTEFGFKYVTTSNSGYSIVEPLDFALELMEQIRPRL